MTDLAGTTLILGGVLGVLYAGMAVCPQRAIEACTRFPRHRISGAVLAALALIWSAWLLHTMPMETLARYKPWLWVLTPLSIFLVVQYMDELLAPRALGGVLALLATPLLDAARFHPSPWRLVIVALAYGFAIKGMALLLSPYLFRKGAAIACRTPARTRTIGLAGLAGAVCLLVLGWFVY